MTGSKGRGAASAHDVLDARVSGGRRAASAHDVLGAAPSKPARAQRRHAPMRMATQNQKRKMWPRSSIGPAMTGIRLPMMNSAFDVRERREWREGSEREGVGERQQQWLATRRRARQPQRVAFHYGRLHLHSQRVAIHYERLLLHSCQWVRKATDLGGGHSQRRLRW